MSRTGIWRNTWNTFLQSFKRNSVGMKNFIGEDSVGNKFYEICEGKMHKIKRLFFIRNCFQLSTILLAN